MKIANNITELIGNTPMVKLNKLKPKNGADIYLKLEFYNPGSSIKDRIALSMIEAAEQDGSLQKEGTIVEPTSGNTGIGLAMIGASKGYNVILVMPDTMSMERRKLLKVFGAKLVLTDGAKGMKGAIEKAEEIVKENPSYFMPQQFMNKANPEAHRKSTALEIIEQMDNDFDMFIAGVGTGGTITGVGEVISNELDKVKIVAVEPESSAVLSGDKPGPHKIQGIGAGFVPDILNVDIIDEVFKVRDEDALETARRVVLDEGILVGISSGAAVYTAIEKAKELGEGKKIVVIIPSYGERYLSVPNFFPE